MIYPEFIMNGEHVSPGKSGTLVITKLYGAGTPIIRYTGIDDIVTTLKNDCCCSLSGILIKKIHGRKNDSILFPEGKMALPSFIDSILGEAFYETKSNKIRRIQIIQHDIDNLEMNILFDKDLRNVGVSPEKIFDILKRKLLEKIGSKIHLEIKEVDSFNKKDPYFISKIDRSKFIEKEYLI
jgi:phenylacetate-coenzyme A ligase PaaK-like adenylate-forming protein